MRVFVALDVPEDVRANISALRAKLEHACPEARWARVEGLHVTLKFIGETSPPKVEQIQARLATIRSAMLVEMSFCGVGWFPNERRPRVFWVGIAATPNLAEIAAEVERRLEVLGIPREQRPFRPHLTLARFDSEKSVEQLQKAVGEWGPLEFGSTRTGELHLYESRLKPGGAEYTRLATFFFVEGAR